MTSTVMSAGESVKRPRMRALTARQIEFVLARNSVARIAFQHDGKVELMPVHYAYVNGSIVGRISLGMKYLNWLVVREVVVEVEEIQGLFDWKSVILRGQVTVLRARGRDDEREAFNRAVDAIRTVIPGAFTEQDPTPDRRFVFRVDPTEVSGREATTK
jgi:nitroimidazol reductase NimA-like FMN-containing flavoprotein (pyridoxamine 5'-phosphate oxidase superfamily)